MFGETSNKSKEGTNKDNNYFKFVFENAFLNGLLIIIAFFIGYNVSPKDPENISSNDSVSSELNKDSILNLVVTNNSLLDRIRNEEAFREFPYHDGKTHSIGYGHNLEAHNGYTERQHQECGNLKEWHINIQQADCVLKIDLYDNTFSFANLWPNFYQQNFRIQVNLADGAFQEGPAGLHRLINCDREITINNIRGSNWYNISERRANMLIEALEGAGKNLCY